MKSWLAQGSSGRRVTLLPGTTFLHINGALNRLEPVLNRVWYYEPRDFNPDCEQSLSFLSLRPARS